MNRRSYQELAWFQAMINKADSVETSSATEPWSTPAARAAVVQEAAAQIAPLAEAKHTEFTGYVDGLTPEQIAQMERMTQETSRAEDYDSRSECGW